MSLQLIRPDINLDFVGKRYFFVALSTLINVAAIVLLFTRGLNYGVDFAGGSVAQIEFTMRTNPEKIQAALAPLDLGEITVQDFGKAGQSFLARFQAVKNIGSIGPRLGAALDKAYGPKPRKWCGSRASAQKSAAICAARALPRLSSRPSSWACTSRSSSAT